MPESVALLTEEVSRKTLVSHFDCGRIFSLSFMPACLSG